jgi:hypothetical protein
LSVIQFIVCPPMYCLSSSMYCLSLNEYIEEDEKNIGGQTIH